MGFLEEITEQRRKDVAASKQATPPEELERLISESKAKYGSNIDVIKRLHATPPQGWLQMALAAEFKRASPSKGDIASHISVKDQAKLYADAGASLMSVLTEPKWFKGSLEDMSLAREQMLTYSENRPGILRKDFIIDEYQLLEARAHGADCVLLIVAILTPEELSALIAACERLNLCPLVEVNCVEELDIALDAGAKLIGVNNRDLRTFQLDLTTTVKIMDALRGKPHVSTGADGVTVLALSGVHSRNDIQRFEKCGAHGVLIGEALMKQDVGSFVNRLFVARRSRASQGSFHTSDVTQPPIVKVCGVTSVEDAQTALRAGADIIGMIFVKGSPRHVSNAVAKEIADAVKRYGERSNDILPTFLEEYHQVKDDYVHVSPEEKVGGVQPTVSEWFQKGANALKEACSRSPLVAGVFMDEPAEFMNEIAAEVGLDLVQLHGDEGFSICGEIKTPTIRVVHLPDSTELDGVDAEAILRHIKGGFANFLLLDTTLKGQKGGTGTTFDWTVACLFRQSMMPCLMAGGLSSENVSKAISVASPLGVDVSSGVEVSGRKGVKDTEKVNTFVKMVKDHFSIASLKIDEEQEQEA